MPRTTTITASEAAQERLCSAYDAYSRACMAAVKSPSLETGRAVTRAESELEWAAVECGMSRLHPDLSGWAAEAVCGFLSRSAA